MNWHTALSVAVLAYTGSGVVKLIRAHRDSELRDAYVSVVRSIRLWTVPAAIACYGVVAGLSLVLLWAVPALRFSWWRFISGSSGNIALGRTGFIGIGWQTIAFVMPILFILVVPTLALMEEHIFRLSRHECGW